MTFLQSIILGALQGISEFLPISSSGHLILLKNFMNINDIPLLYDILLHFATLIVVCAVFYKKIWSLIKSFFRIITKKTVAEDAQNINYIIIIIIATIITGTAGFLLKDILPENPILISALLLVTGIILLTTKIVTLFYKNNFIVFDKKKSIIFGTILGVAQSIGIFPGISRSGITVSSALISRVDKKEAGDLSFLISIPAILGATILDIKNIDKVFETMNWTVLFAGIVSAMVVGFISLILLLKLIRSGNFYLFAIYLIPAGIIGIIYFSKFNI